MVVVSGKSLQTYRSKGSAGIQSIPDFKERKELLGLFHCTPLFMIIRELYNHYEQIENSSKFYPIKSQPLIICGHILHRMFLSISYYYRFFPRFVLLDFT